MYNIHSTTLQKPVEPRSSTDQWLLLFSDYIYIYIYILFLDLYYEERQTVLHNDNYYNNASDINITNESSISYSWTSTTSS
jgi:hypothetical protein